MPDTRITLQLKQSAMVAFATLLLSMSLSASSGDAPGVESGLVSVPGASLYYEAAGAGDPVILIHGGYLDRRMWDEQFEAFARNYRVIRYDVRGHGLSHAEAVAFSDHEDLHELMLALGVRKATIIGLSMGGLIAVDFALAYPDMTRALVLVGPGLSGFPHDDPGTLQYIEAMKAAFQDGGLAAANEIFTRYWCDGPRRQPADVDPAVRGKVLEMLAGSGGRWEIWKLARQLDPPAVNRLNEITVPTLVMLGSIDMPVIQTVVEKVAAEVPHARMVVIDGVAHMVNLEAPQQFDEKVLAFLGGL